MNIADLHELAAKRRSIRATIKTKQRSAGDRTLEIRGVDYAARPTDAQMLSERKNIK